MSMLRLSWLALAVPLLACAPKASASAPAPPSAPPQLQPVAAPSVESIPVEPPKPAPRQASIVPRTLSTGGIYNCSIEAGLVYCWGLDRNHPSGRAFRVEGVEGAVEVASGPYSACARTNAGEVVCWNEYATHRIEGVASARSIAVGSSYACAAQPSGVKCWSPGYLKDQTPIVRAVHGVDDPIQVAAAYYHACALEEGGAVKCWGNNESGGLGVVNPDLPTFDEGYTLDDQWLGVRALPAPVPPQRRPLRVVASENALNKCVARIGGPGDGLDLIYELSVDEAGLVTAVAQISSNLDDHAHDAFDRCATAVLFSKVRLKPKDGNAKTVRYSVYARDQAVARHTAHASLEGAVGLAARAYLTCAAMRNGELECWGHTYGLDGPGVHGTRVESPRGTPALIEGVNDAASLSIGWRHACAQRTDGSHVCFGGNGEGTFGPEVPLSTEFGVHEIDKRGEYTEISAGPTLTCGRRESGAVWCWGVNDGGRLGIGDEAGGTHAPAPVVGLP